MPDLLTSAWLAPAVHIAWVEDDVVVLDLRSDEYACLVDAGALIKRLDEAGRFAFENDAVRDDLLEMGLVTRSPSPPPRSIIKPNAALQLHSLPKPGDIARVAINAVRSTANFKGRTLSAMIAEDPLRKPTRSPDRRASVSVAAGAFEAVRPYIPFEGDCLQHAYMLRDHLGRCGLKSDWVFGVRTWPFLAHCWIQIDDLVVGDSLERVGAFVPIMRV